MAKKKRKRSRQGIVSKAVNVGLILLGFSRVIEILMVGGGGIHQKVRLIKNEATFGLSDGAFNLNAGLRMYSPAGAAMALGTFKSFLMKKFPVRR